MFRFSIMDDYEKRKVGRFDSPDGKIMVSTAIINDSVYLFETGIAHPLYNENKILIVENYDTKEKAQEGHERWVQIMTSPEKNLPTVLADIGGSEINRLIHELLDGEILICVKGQKSEWVKGIVAQKKLLPIQQKQITHKG